MAIEGQPAAEGREPGAPAAVLPSRFVLALLACTRGLPPRDSGGDELDRWARRELARQRAPTQALRRRGQLALQLDEATCFPAFPTFWRRRSPGGR